MKEIKYKSIALLRHELQTEGIRLGKCVSRDTQHILAWVKQNNPKAEVPERYSKNKQPVGDPDCRLGCKRRHNQHADFSDAAHTPRPRPPTTNPVLIQGHQVGEFYWGYVRASWPPRCPAGANSCWPNSLSPLAKPDVSYFYPLMEATEQRLGCAPSMRRLMQPLTPSTSTTTWRATRASPLSPFANGAATKTSVHHGGLAAVCRGLGHAVQYVLINLHALERVRAQKAEAARRRAGTAG